MYFVVSNKYDIIRYSLPVTRYPPPVEKWRHSNIYVLYEVSRAPRDREKGFVKGEALRLLKINSSIKTFEENIATFKKQPMKRGYPQNFINNTLSLP